MQRHLPNTPSPLSICSSDDMDNNGKDNCSVLHYLPQDDSRTALVVNSSWFSLSHDYAVLSRANLFVSQLCCKGFDLTPGFNPDWKKRDPVYKLPPKVQRGSFLGDVVKRFALCYRTAFCPVLSVCLSCLWRWCIVAKRLGGSRCHLVRR